MLSIKLEACCPRPPPLFGRTLYLHHLGLHVYYLDTFLYNSSTYVCISLSNTGIVLLVFKVCINDVILHGIFCMKSAGYFLNLRYVYEIPPC